MVSAGSRSTTSAMHWRRCESEPHRCSTSCRTICTSRITSDSLTSASNSSESTTLALRAGAAMVTPTHLPPLLCARKALCGRRAPKLQPPQLHLGQAGPPQRARQLHQAVSQQQHNEQQAPRVCSRDEEARQLTGPHALRDDHPDANGHHDRARHQVELEVGAQRLEQAGLGREVACGPVLHQHRRDDPAECKGRPENELPHAKQAPRGPPRHGIGNVGRQQQRARESQKPAAGSSQSPRAWLPPASASTWIRTS